MDLLMKITREIGNGALKFVYFITFSLFFISLGKSDCFGMCEFYCLFALQPSPPQESKRQRGECMHMFLTTDCVCCLRDAL